MEAEAKSTTTNNDGQKAQKYTYDELREIAVGLQQSARD